MNWPMTSRLLGFFTIIFQASNHLLGPKPFPLDRLLAIFYSIVEDKISPSAIIFSQVRFALPIIIESLFWH